MSLTAHMSGSHEEHNFWFSDRTTPLGGMQYAVSRVVVAKRTRYQNLAIVETPTYGKALILDGNWQSCVSDEFVYHEALVHPAMVAHGAPQRVAILGGGEGATLRDVLRWSSVERALMIDIDGEVLEACRTHLPEMHQGAFDDRRADVLVADALEWIDTTAERFDVVISDVSEPLEEGPAFKLFTVEHFDRVRHVLRPDGCVALQAGSAAPHDCAVFARVVNTVRAVFADVRAYVAAVPSFGTPWGFVLASDKPLGNLPDAEAIDRLLASRATGALRSLDGRALAALFALPVFLQRALAGETRVYTLRDPPRL